MEGPPSVCLSILDRNQWHASVAMGDGKCCQLSNQKSNRTVGESQSRAFRHTSVGACQTRQSMASLSRTPRQAGGAFPSSPPNPSPNSKIRAQGGVSLRARLDFGGKKRRGSSESKHKTSPSGTSRESRSDGVLPEGLCGAQSRGQPRAALRYLSRALYNLVLLCLTAGWRWLVCAVLPSTVTQGWDQADPKDAQSAAARALAACLSGSTDKEGVTLRKHPKVSFSTVRCRAARIGRRRSASGLHTVGQALYLLENGLIDPRTTRFVAVSGPHTGLVAALAFAVAHWNGKDPILSVLLPLATTAVQSARETGRNLWRSVYLGPKFSRRVHRARVKAYAKLCFQSADAKVEAAAGARPRPSPPAPHLHVVASRPLSPTPLAVACDCASDAKTLAAWLCAADYEPFLDAAAPWVALGEHYAGGSFAAISQTESQKFKRSGGRNRSVGSALLGSYDIGMRDLQSDGLVTRLGRLWAGLSLTGALQWWGRIGSVYQLADTDQGVAAAVKKGYHDAQRAHATLMSRLEFAEDVAHGITSGDNTPAKVAPYRPINA